MSKDIHLCTLQVHIVVPDLKINSKNIDKGDVISTKPKHELNHSQGKESSRNYVHIAIRR